MKHDPVLYATHHQMSSPSSSSDSGDSQSDTEVQRRVSPSSSRYRGPDNTYPRNRNALPKRESSLEIP
jgi:hypothetical protein